MPLPRLRGRGWGGGKGAKSIHQNYTPPFYGGETKHPLPTFGSKGPASIHPFPVPLPVRITKSLQSKIEEMLLASGIRVRYEKGNFRGGYCHLQDEQLVVINKFFPFESRVNLLIDLAAQLPLNPNALDDDQRKLLEQIRQEAVRRSQANLFTSEQ